MPIFGIPESQVGFFTRLGHSVIIKCTKINVNKIVHIQLTLFSSFILLKWFHLYFEISIYQTVSRRTFHTPRPDVLKFKTWFTSIVACIIIDKLDKILFAHVPIMKLFLKSNRIKKDVYLKRKLYFWQMTMGERWKQFDNV